jgi:hypothetical protein
MRTSRQCCARQGPTWSTRTRRGWVLSIAKERLWLKNWLERGYICLVTAEKDSLVDSVDLILADLRSGAALVFPTRASISSYPHFQQVTEWYLLRQIAELYLRTSFDLGFFVLACPAVWTGVREDG